MNGVRKVYEDLGYEIKGQSGGQFLADCRHCGKEKHLYINQETGQYMCHVCQEKGNCISAVRQEHREWDTPTVMQWLRDRGMTGDGKTINAKQPPKMAPVRERRILTEPELLKFCTRKGINSDTFHKWFGPMYDVYDKMEQEVVAIPAYSPDCPGGPGVPISWLYARLDGEDIYMGGSKRAKYVCASGGSHGLVGVRRLFAENPDEVVICEGWKDAVAVNDQGYVAVASTGGCNIWRDEWNEWFKDKVIYLIPDMDEPGIKGMQLKADKLSRVATVRLCPLPHDITKSNGYDAHDFCVQAGMNPHRFKEEVIDKYTVHQKEHSHIVLDACAQNLADEFHERSPDKYVNYLDIWAVEKDKKYEEVSQIGKYPKDILDQMRLMVKALRTVTVTKDGPQERCINVTDLLVKNILSNFGALPEVSIKDRKCMPPFWIEQHDGLPDPKDIVPFNDCLLDISGPEPKRLAHSTNYFCLNYLPYNYDPDAGCPIWENFVRDIMSREVDGRLVLDEAGLNCLQEFLGLCLTSDTSFQKILTIIGPKRSGKGTVGRILQSLVGVENYVSTDIHTLAGDFGLSTFLSKSVAVITDADFSKSPIRAATTVERLKQISGEDAVTINRKNRPLLPATRLATRILILGNIAEALHDPSGALVARLLVLRTMRSWYGNEDTELEDKLLGELSGIVNWCLVGLARLRQRGRFVESEIGESEKSKLHEAATPLRAFADDCCEIVYGQEILAKELYDVYCAWADEHGRSRMNLTRFVANLRSAFFGEAEIDYVRKRDSRGRRGYVTGLCLSEEMRAAVNEANTKADLWNS